MRKISIFTFITLLTFFLSAQTREGDSKFGIVAGVNAAYLVGDDAEDWIEDFEDDIDDLDDQNGLDAEGGIKPRIGVHFGFSYDYFIADNIALSSGLVYSMKGFTLNQKLDGTVTSGGYPYYYSNNYDRELDAAIQLNYIDLPIVVKYATDEGFELSAGLLISLLASDKVDFDYDDANSSYDYYDDFDDYEDAFGEDPEGTVMGLQFGIGYTFNEKFNISLKLQQGGEFGEISDEDENKNRTLQLSTALYF